LDFGFLFLGSIVFLFSPDIYTDGSEGRSFFMKCFVPLLLALIAFSLFGVGAYAQVRYSYVDEDGVQNFTNVAPVRPVYDLKVTGTPDSPALQPENSLESRKFDPLIEKYASENRLDPSLIRSIIAQESGFNPKAVSSKGARGLMQLMPETAASLGVKNSFDPEQNIQGGVKHFRFLMDNFNNNLELSLAAYNAGQNLVQRLGRIPAIKETKDYVQSIKKMYRKKELNSQALDLPEPSQTFRFVDDSGILHLTNIPPSRQ
jgi:soluble lytic murein transglycosylase-like protein